FEHREHRPDTVQRNVLHFTDTARRTGEDELPYGNASGIIADNERRYGSGRRERTRAVHIADNLGHCLTHVRSWMKDQLHERDALNVLAFDVLDARDVQEMVFEVIGEESLHLLRVHASIRLRHIDSRRTEVRKDV